MILSRRVLTDRQWAIIAPLVPGKKGGRGRTGTDNRLFLAPILWLARGFRQGDTARLCYARRAILCPSRPGSRERRVAIRTIHAQVPAAY
ncbi:MAG TPA: hypothetical protein DHC76_16640 [Rhodobacteraceae bacterium]|nr:hypothetical protein [Paracoccaceae bacterium]